MTKTAKALTLGFFMALGIGYVSYSITKAEAEPAELKGTPVKPDLALNLAAVAPKDLKVTALKIGAANMVLFRGAFDSLSVARAQQELIGKSLALPRGEHLYLILDTPGGEIPAGEQLIATAQNIGRPVDTITIFAASMGFNTVQQLGHRYILPAGMLMAHRARVGGIGGQVPGEFITAAAGIVHMVERFETKNARRLGIDLPTYTNLVKDEYWVEGDDAVRQNAADDVASIQCDNSLSGTHTQQVQSPFGPVELIWDNCPAITSPVGFTFQGGAEEGNKVRAMISDLHLFRKMSLQ